MFADDKNVFYAGKIITEVNDVLNNELKQTSQLFNSLNINKMDYMCFHNKPYLDYCKPKTDGLDVSRVQVTKCS